MISSHSRRLSGSFYFHLIPSPPLPPWLGTPDLSSSDAKTSPVSETGFTHAPCYKIPMLMIILCSTVTNAMRCLVNTHLQPLKGRAARLRGSGGSALGSLAARYLDTWCQFLLLTLFYDFMLSSKRIQKRLTARGLDYSSVVGGRTLQDSHVLYEQLILLLHFAEFLGHITQH